MNNLKEKPLKELMQYSAKELRHAASYIDRDNGKHQIINAITLFKKLKELNATMIVSSDESGSISFKYKGEIINRVFVSAAEMSLAINVGPTNLFTKELYYKTKQGSFKCEITAKNKLKNTISIYVKELDLHQLIHLNGLEKVLCNTPDGLTAGQQKLRDFKL